MSEATAAPTFRKMSERFRGYLPVVVDVETGGFDWNRHALLEIAVQPIARLNGNLDQPGTLTTPLNCACKPPRPTAGTIAIPATTPT